MYPSLTVQTVQTCYSYPNIPAALGFQLSPQPLSPTLLSGSLSPPIHRRAMSPGPQYESSLVRRSMSPLPYYERITAIKTPPFLYRQDSHFKRKIQESGSSTVAIDNKIEQAMDLVKSHLMFAVREEVEVLKEQIKELTEKNNQLEYEVSILRTSASPDTLLKLNQPRPQPPPATSS